MSRYRIFAGLHSEQLRRFTSNLSWLTADKVVRLGVGLAVGAAIARYLGPARFGTLNFALAVVALFSAAAGLGLDPIVQRDLVRGTATPNVAIGTCLVMKLTGGLLAYILLLLFSCWISTDAESLKISLIVGLTLLNAVLPSFDNWFQSQVQARFSVWAQNLSFLLMTILRIWFLFARKPLSYFAWLIVAEAFLSAAILASFYYFRSPLLFTLKLDWHLGKSWLLESWPVILTGLAIMLYMRVDQVMLAKMSGQHEVGIYSAAVRISEIGYFIPMMLASTFLPSIIRSRELLDRQYLLRRQHFFDLNSVIAFGLIVPCTLLARPIIALLYGNLYSEAASILQVHAWAALFVFTGVARAQYLLSESLLRFSFYSTAAGAVVNILLNLVLIPRLGGFGAAWATLIAQALSAFASSFASPRVRTIGYQQLKSLLLPVAIIRLCRLV